MTEMKKRGMKPSTIDKLMRALLDVQNSVRKGESYNWYNICAKYHIAKSSFIKVPSDIATDRIDRAYVMAVYESCYERMREYNINRKQEGKDVVEDEHKMPEQAMLPFNVTVEEDAVYEIIRLIKEQNSKIDALIERMAN